MRAQVTIGAKPVYFNRLIGSNGGVDSNTNRFVSVSTFPKSADVTLFWVGTVRSTINGWGTLWGHFEAGYHDRDLQLRNTYGTTMINWHTDNDNSECQLPYSPDTPVLYYATMKDGAQMFLSMTAGGKTLEKSANRNRTWQPGNAYIYLAGSENGNENLNGYIGEVIYYQRVLSASEIAAVVSYLRKKWGI